MGVTEVADCLLRWSGFLPAGPGGARSARILRASSWQARHVSSRDVGERLSRPAKGENGGYDRGVVARRGRPDLSPTVPLSMAFPLSCRVPALWEWGRGPAGRGLTLGREPSISRL